jgi:hypothetical protein
MLVLTLARNYARLTVWIAVSAACVAAYAFRYNLMSSQSDPHHSLLSVVLHPRPLYVIAFMGNAAGFPVKQFCFVLGFALSFFFAYLIYRGYTRKNPLVSCCVLFLLMTAIGVAGLRSGLGLGQSLAPRYAIYSALLVIFAWFAIVEEFLLRDSGALRRNGILLCAVALTVTFSLSTDASGRRYLIDRNQVLIAGFAAFEHPPSPDSTVGPVLTLPHDPPQFRPWYPWARAVLIRSITLGVYRPPAYKRPAT